MIIAETPNATDFFLLPHVSSLHCEISIMIWGNVWELLSIPTFNKELHNSTEKKWYFLGPRYINKMSFIFKMCCFFKMSFHFQTCFNFQDTFSFAKLWTLMPYLCSPFYVPWYQFWRQIIFKREEARLSSVAKIDINVKVTTWIGH